jgi:crotonobetainyl-CoA:carnitine CoA-transferase CaiB-like acyl-CoA transferase
MGKLDGIRVVDLSLFLPGPMLTCMLADQGAEVVKVEPPGGDPARAMEPFEAGTSFWFRNLNRGKTCVELDLKTEDGRNSLWALIRQADVLVEGFRPGVMPRLGFGYEACAAANPRLVYCSISAFGQAGPLADHPAHDLGAWALSGFLSVNDTPDGTPVVPGVPASDMAAGLTGCAAVLMALLGRERTGRGDFIDLSMFGSLLPWSAHVAGEAVVEGRPPLSNTQRSLGGHAFYQVYACRDRRHIVLCGREAKFAKNLLEALGRPDLIPMAALPPGEAHAPLKAFLTETFATRTRDQWTEWFHGRDIAFAPVLDFAEALAQPAVRKGGLLVEQTGAHLFAPAIRFAGEPGWAPPPPGENRDTASSAFRRG